jgi:hypothetical protein
MTHLFQHNPHPCQPALRTGRLFRNRKWILLSPLAGLVLACAACSEAPVKPPPTVPVTDTRPVGEGLKLIGWAMLGAAVVGVLGRLMR